MKNNPVVITFNKKIIFSFLFTISVFFIGIYSIFIVDGDNRHSASFYNYGGIFIILIIFPFLLAYAKNIFINKKVAFYIDKNKFIYNNPLVDVPNPILWNSINKIEKVELPTYKFIAISFYDNEQYIKQLNPFWKYMANFRLKQFGFPLMINENDMIDIDFDHLLKIFLDNYQNYKTSNKSLDDE